MKTRLYSNESLRIETNFSECNFIDIKSMDWEQGLMVSNWSTNKQYIEIRKKDTQIAMFLFNKKSDKKSVNFGWWEDAEVVYSINEVKP